MNDDLVQVITVSLKVAVVASIIVVCCSIFLAHCFVNSRYKFLRIFEIFVYVPMAMPPVALGYGLLIALGPRSAIGIFLQDVFDTKIAFSFYGAVLAAVMVSLGIGVRSMRLAYENIDVRQIQVAQSLGAKPLTIFFRIVLPQCRSTVLAAAILVFIRALGEFGATIILAGNSLGETRTLALAIWVGMETPGKEPYCLVLIGIAVLISFVALFVSELVLRNQSRF